MAIVSLPSKTSPVRARTAVGWDAAILRSIPDAVIGVSCASRIVMLNPAAEDLLGVSFAEAVDLHWNTLFQLVPEPAGSPPVVEPVLARSSDSESRIGRVFLPKPRREILALTSAAAVSEDAGDLAAVVVIRDITSPEKIRRDFFRSRHLDSLQEFAGGLASAFTNLITAMQGSVEVLSKHQAVLNDREPRHFQSLLRALDSATSLTRQLLAFSRRLPADARLVDVNSTITAIFPLLRQQAGPDCRVVLELAHDLWRIEMDASHLEEVILALVRNAGESMPGGGSVRLSTRNCEITPQQALQFVDMPAGSYVMLEVSDTGSCLGSDLSERIFEPFFSARPRARGVGLSTAYGLTKQAGGHISYDTSPREGTRFFLYWPKGAAIRELSGTNAALQGNETVLVVEPEASTRDVVQRALLTNGYHVLESTTTSDALRTCRQWDGHIHLMLLNVLTHSSTGAELGRRLLTLRPETKLLFMSNYSPSLLEREGAFEIQSRFIQKPFSPEALARRIRQTLDAH